MDQDAPLYNANNLKVYFEYLEKRDYDFDRKAVLDRAGIPQHDYEDSASWLRQGQVDRFHEALVELTGNSNLAREVGQSFISSEAGAGLTQAGLKLLSPASVYMLMRTFYSLVSRAARLEVKRLGRATVEILVAPKQGVDEKPYQCLNRIGVFEAASLPFTGAFADVQHSECFHQGAPACRYVISWRDSLSMRVKRWRNVLSLLVIAAVIGLLFVLPVHLWALTALAMLLALMSLTALGFLLESRELRRTVEQTRGDADRDMLDEMRARENHATLLREVSLASATERDSRALLKRITGQMGLHLDTDRCAAWLLTDEGTQVSLAVSHGYDTEEEALIRKLVFDMDKMDEEGVLKETIDQLVPKSLCGTKELQEGFSSRVYQAMKMFGIGSILLVPIAHEKEFLGVLTVSSSSERRFTSSETSFVMAIATQAAMSMAAARHAEERRDLETRLLQAQKMEAVGTLAGGIAHDFNNLLMGIQGSASVLLADMPRSHPDREIMRGIEDCVSQGAELTQQLLGFARLGKYDPRALHLNDVVDQTLQIFERTHKDLEIQRSFEDVLEPVWADRGQIEHTVLQLCVNAAAAMPEGGTLHVSTARSALEPEMATAFDVEAGDYALLIVEDSGVGMDEATRQRIFEPFFTTQDTARHGAGLGLASVYGIIKNHGGHIEVKSETGLGSQFLLWLPKSEEVPDGFAQERPAVEPQRHDTEPPSQSDVDDGRPVVLLVDDEPLVRKACTRLLDYLGYSVFSAASGSEALTLYEERGDTFSLVILDMVMPGLSGEATFLKLQELDHDVPVLLSSGYSLDENTSRLLEMGCRGFLHKPFDMETLSSQVEEHRRHEGSQ